MLPRVTAGLPLEETRRPISSRVQSIDPSCAVVMVMGERLLVSGRVAECQSTKTSIDAHTVDTLVATADRPRARAPIPLCANGFAHAAAFAAAPERRFARGSMNTIV